MIVHLLYRVIGIGVVMINALFLVSSAGILFYLWMRYRYGYWKRKGVFSPEAKFPFGHLGDVFMLRTQIGVRLAQIYESYKKEPYVGIFLLHTKVLLVNDLELAKTVLVRDFAHFPDHGLGVSATDPLSNHLFNMEGAAWRAMRAKLTATFTSSKMRYMFGTLLECSGDLERYIEREVGAGRDVVEFKETMARYATDVIGLCAFGIEARSFESDDAEFRRVGRKIFDDTTFWKSFKDMLSVYAPSLVVKFRLRIVPKEVEDYLVRIIERNIRRREESGDAKNDFLQLLIDMKKMDEQNNQKSLDLVEITAQVFLFFVAGFETSATTSNFVLYELAKNPELQKKLRADIFAALEKHGGQLTYECVMDMHYLTQTIEEALRMYPPVPFLFRKCVKNYTLPGTKTVIEKGTQVMIPILGIQRDPAVHADPSQFRPERFSAENRKLMNPFSALAFGEGPRICIGNRFGMMQTKLGLISVLSKYEVSITEKTQIPMIFEPKSFILTCAGGHFLKVTRCK